MFFKHRWKIFFIVTIVCFFLDWLTKYLVSTNLYGHIPVRIVGEYVQFMLVYNKAALFGIDPRHWLPGFPLNAFFFVFSIIAIIVIVFYFKTLRNTDMTAQLGLMLILPGALGNLFDRVLHPQSGVVDFIRVGISETVYWPIFNLADAYVTVGVLLIFVNFLIEEQRQKKKKSANGVLPDSSVKSTDVPYCDE
ncbi:MAG TPA: signal peptidase II [Fibrobacteres bacterium]|nr:signal peptidase II [Fibrobacterota bacterium]